MIEQQRLVVGIRKWRISDAAGKRGDHACSNRQWNVGAEIRLQQLVMGATTRRISDAAGKRGDHACRGKQFASAIAVQRMTGWYQNAAHRASTTLPASGATTPARVSNGKSVPKTQRLVVSVRTRRISDAVGKQDNPACTGQRRLLKSD